MKPLFQSTLVRALCSIVIATVFSSTSLAQENPTPSDKEATLEELKKHPDYIHSIEALRDHIPTIAAERLQKLSTSPLTAEAKIEISLLLAEANVRSIRPALALAALADIPEHSSARYSFWKSQALAISGRYNDATSAFKALLETPPGPFHDRSRLTLSSLLSSLQLRDEAITVLDPIVEKKQSALAGLATLYQADLLIQSEKFERAAKILEQDHPKWTKSQSQFALYLRGKLSLLTKQPAKAQSAFSSLIDADRGLPHRLRTGATLGLAQAEISLGENDAGFARLLKLVDTNISNSLLDQAFPILISLADNNETIRRTLLDKLAQWSELPSSLSKLKFNTGIAGIAATQRPLFLEKRTRLSLFYRARLLATATETNTQARSLLKRLRLSQGSDRLSRLSLIDTALLLQKDGQTDLALTILGEAQDLAISPEIKATAAFLIAKLSSEEGDSPESLAAAFIKATTIENEAISNAAAFNASLYALEAQDDKLLQATQAQISNPEMKQTLDLEIALNQRFRNSQSSRIALSTFISDSISHPRIDEARIALAEASTSSQPIDIVVARRQIDELNPSQVDPARLVLLKIKVAKLEQNYGVAAKAAEDFIAANPSAPHIARVQLAHAHALFQNKETYAAWQIFETVAKRENISVDLKETALFFAAISASKGGTPAAREAAIPLLQQVVKINGGLASPARRELATLLFLFDRNQEAFDTLSPLLTSNSVNGINIDASILAATAHRKLAGSNPKHFESALDLYQTALSRTDLTASQRNEILFLTGDTFEAKGDKTSAFRTYYEVVNRESAKDSEIPDYLWFEKCGFKLISLLVSEKKYAAAVSVAKKIQAANGPRAQEAKARAEKLSLEHMLFDE